MKVEYDAFRACTELTNASFPNATVINDGVFFLCTKLASVNLPSATAIGMAVFGGCPELTSVRLPNAKTIGGGAFQNCSKLVSINLPSVTGIGLFAFENCPLLTSMSLGVTNGSNRNFLNIGTYPNTIYLLDSAVTDLMFDGTSYVSTHGGTIKSYDISITNNPVSVVQELGTAATLSVNATMLSDIPWNTLSYQWEKEINGVWVALGGKTEKSLTIASLTKEDAGMYRCNVTAVENPALAKTSGTASISSNLGGGGGNKPQPGSIPKTGDSTNVGYLSLGVLISGIFVIGCFKKKKFNR